MANYYISDYHLYDKTAYSGDWDERVAQIIKKWNNHIKPEDTVYIVGDVCSGRFTDEKIAEKVCEFLDSVVGEKVLIIGNHDELLFNRGLGDNIKERFSRITYKETVMDSGIEVFLAHYPLEEFPGSFRRNSIMLYGHVHTFADETFIRCRRMLNRSCPDELLIHKVLNVGCMFDYMDDTPRSIQELLEVERVQSEQMLEIHERYDLDPLLDELSELRYAEDKPAKTKVDTKVFIKPWNTYSEIKK